MVNDITTIQIRGNVKAALDKLRERNQSYEEIISSLMRLAEQHKRKQQELLIEGCKAMAEENLKITKEFEAIEDLKDWEW